MKFSGDLSEIYPSQPTAEKAHHLASYLDFDIYNRQRHMMKVIILALSKKISLKNTRGQSEIYGI